MSERREAVLRAIVQSMPVATVALDGAGTVHVWNRAAEDMFGWAAADVVGGPAPFALGDAVGRAGRGEIVAPVRAQLGARDARVLDVEVRAAPLRDDSGRAVGAVVVFTELTAEQRASERDLENTQAALARAEEMRGPHAPGDAGLNAETDADALRDATKREELLVFYQPIVRLADARCVGAHGRLRWQHPERGLLPSAEIMPLALEHDLADDISAWLLERAIVQAARWQLEQPDFEVSINVSASELARPGLSVLAGALIRREGVAPGSIGVDIAEHALTSDGVEIVVDELRAIGVRVIVDEFAADGAAFAALERVAVDAVKLDHALVDAARVDRAHALGVRVIGGGVDEEAQLEPLLDAACDDAIGNLFAPPQPASDLQLLVSPTRRWRPPGSRVMRRG